jgi:hypothetical protein
MLTAFVLYAALAAGTDEMKTASKLQIPYRPKELSHCYERMPQTRKFLQDGLSQARSILESEEPFQKRLDEAMKINQETLQRATVEPPVQTWLEQDVYLCCLYDMLEAAFAAEADRIIATKADASKKKEDLQALLKSIEGLGPGSPQYRSGIKPRLVKTVQNALKKIS